ncbi:transposase [Rhabdochromatium marinum]|uniref:transposase n=1 Tax=Rhabdochromatium marinum TaxID=48729 RepID=UPI003B834784|nr:hypothetical protein [Rhabdochromatium marinum]
MSSHFFGKGTWAVTTTFLSTLESYMTEIINYFVHRDSSGFVEGLNNKIKVIKRRRYRILNVGRLLQRVFLDLSGRKVFFLQSISYESRKFSKNPKP